MELFLPTNTKKSIDTFQADNGIMPEVHTKSYPQAVPFDSVTGLITNLTEIPSSLISNADRQVDNNSIVMACYNWASRNIIEPPLVLYQESLTTETEKYIDDLALTPIIKPSRMWSFNRMVQAWTLSLMFYGNAYALIQRDKKTGFVKGLQWMEPWNIQIEGEIEPSLYRYTTPNGRTMDLPPEAVLHIPFGIDPSNRLIGCSPLRGVMKWALTDNEAALYTLAIMKNQGKRTLVLSPTHEKARFSKDAMEKMAKLYQSAMTGHNAGRILAMDSGVNIQEVGMSPEESALDKMLRVPERKITAAFGIHMVVVGLLDNPSYSNFNVAERVVTEDFLVPYWKTIACALTDQVYPYTPTFRAKPSAYYGFDLTRVRSLQEDEDKRHLRYNKDFYYGIAKRSECRKALGFEVTPEDDVYYHDILADMKNQQSSSESTPARREGLPLEDTRDDRTPR